MKVPDNTIVAHIRLFDLDHEVKVEIGQYENLTFQDASVDLTIKDIRKAFNKLIKQFEIDLTNFKKGS